MGGERMGRILVVEDHPDINRILTDTLRRGGYEVVSTDNAIDALSLFRAQSFQCVITDLRLPVKPGEELIRELREISQVHIIVVTAKATTEDKLHNLRQGADDYLYKPFLPEEIRYKVDNLFAKLTSSTTHSFFGGAFVLEEGNNTIVVDGAPIELTSVEYRMLRHMVRHPRQVIQRDAFLNVMYDQEEDVYDRVVDVHIKNIRAKLKHHTNRRIIKTIYGLGYAFEGDPDA
jgi:DNA-binding response OmpR family regulator